MKKIYFQPTIKEGIIILLLVLLSSQSPLLFSQDPYQKPPPAKRILPEGEENNLKSDEAAMAWAWTTSYNSNKGFQSDYFVYFQWSDLTWHCKCDHRYNIKFYTGGKTYVLGDFYVTSYSGLDADVPLGPSSSGTYTWRADEYGHSDIWIFGWYCIGACTGASWYQNSAYSYSSTAIPRTPSGLTASQGKYQHRIDLIWSTDTDIPVGDRVYKIYRDGAYIGQTTGSTTHYEDEDPLLRPARSYNYAVYLNYKNSTTAGHTSSAATVTGTTFDLNLRATSQSDGVFLQWDTLNGKTGKSGNLDHYQLDRINPLDSSSLTVSDNIQKTTQNKLDNQNPIPGFLYKYVLTPYPTDSYFPDTTWGKRLANGTITGHVLTPTGQAVEDVRVCAVRQNSVPQDTNTTYCAMTDTSGKFTIRNIYYYELSSFVLTPYREGHGFDPGAQGAELELDPHTTELPQIFIDTSAFTVWGQVLLPSPQGNCPIEGVDIYVYDAEELDPDTLDILAVTDQEGKFAFTVGRIGKYTVRPGMEGHAFDPVKATYKIDSDTNLAVFLDTTTFVLSGYVKASCDSYIGQAELTISAGGGMDPCFDTLVETDTLTGYYQVELPARDYEVKISSFDSESPGLENEEVEMYFPAMQADLTFGDVETNFIYRSEPTLNITGFHEYGCGDYENVPIVDQGTRYTLTFEVREVFGDKDCLADTGYIVVQNHLGNETEKVDTLYLEGGLAEYKLVPGYPNLIAPNTKDLTVTAYVENEYISQSIDVLVQGNRPREQTFTTVSPEIPLMILRDPPGDGSYSYLEEGTTTQTALKFSTQASGSVNIWAEVKAGAKFESGFGVMVETEIWGKLRGSLEVGSSITGQNEFTLNISSGERFSTSGNQDIIGKGGDIFIGSALNLVYALTDVVKYDPGSCSAKKSVSLSMGVDGFATTFMYTGSHIRDNLIPNLAYIRDYYVATDNDSADFYANQIDVWLQTLKMNEDLKEKSSLIDNYTLSAGVEYESWREVATTRSTSIEYSVYIEAAVALEAGIEVGGVGASGGVEAKFRMEFGSSESWAETFSRKTGFYLNDDDPGDAFTMEIRGDRVYGTPVFKVIAGNSSCPWEPGSLPREGVQITSDSYIQFVDDPDGQAVFRLQLGNISQSDEDRIYNLVFDQASNPDGAVLTLGGSQVQGGIPTPYYVSAGSSKQALVTVERGPDAFDYNDLQFTLYSGCDDDQIRDTVYLDVHFKSACSLVSLTKPAQNWVLSSVNNGKLKIRVQDYDESLLDHIGVQIARKGIFNWQDIFYRDKVDLEPNSTDETIDLGEFEDGEYDLRAVLECSSGKAYSDVVSGKIDTKAPILFGLPEPSDLVFDSGDMITVTFDEFVNCYRISSDNVVFRNLSTGETIEAAAGCQDKTIVIIPDLSGKTFEGDTFNVQLSGVEDLYGNAMKEPVSWSFVMNADPKPAGDEDTDLDGIQNGSDNCPYSANADQADLDKDGKGDVCDEDLDGDGVLNVTDNCLMTVNADQADVNQDGIGDACQDFTGNVEITNAGGFYFSNNFPNPFSEKTTLQYVLPSESQVIMKVLDVVGNEVEILVYQKQSAGEYEVTWDARNFDSGIYFCTIYVESFSNNDVAWKTIKMVLSK
jgi:hypothetical protein